MPLVVTGLRFLGKTLQEAARGTPAPEALADPAADRANPPQQVEASAARVAVKAAEAARPSVSSVASLNPSMQMVGGVLDPRRAKKETSSSSPKGGGRCNS